MLAIGESSGNVSISPLVGVEEWSAQRTESQLHGFSSDERPARQRGRCPADVSNHIVALSPWHSRSILNRAKRQAPFSVFITNISALKPKLKPKLLSPAKYRGASIA